MMDRLNLVSDLKDDLLLSEFFLSEQNFAAFQLQKVAEGVSLETFARLRPYFEQLKIMRLHSDGRALMIDAYEVDGMLIKMFMRHPLDYQCEACQSNLQFPSLCQVLVEGHNGKRWFYGENKAYLDLDLMTHTVYDPNMRKISHETLSRVQVKTEERPITV